MERYTQRELGYVPRKGEFIVTEVSSLPKLV